jgi:hypothetical protein
MEQRVYDTQQDAIDSEAFFFGLKSYPSAVRFARIKQRATDNKWYWMNPTAEYLVGLNQVDLDKLDNDWSCTIEEYQSSWTAEEE